MFDSSAAPVRAITFDLDYTLWDLAGVLHSAERLQHGYLAEHFPEAARRYSHEALQALRFEVYRQRTDLRYNVTELRKAVLRQVAGECGYGEDMVEQTFQVFLDARHQVRLYQDVEPLLKRLHGHYVLGVITNGNADVRRFGIGKYFDFALTPMDIGAAKPDRLIFEAACHHAGADPAEVVHVGDDPEADVIGAARYGMQPVWLNRTGAVWPQELAPPTHLELSSLTEFERRLRQPDPVG